MWTSSAGDDALSGDCGVNASINVDDDDSVDPRVQEELERLNNATDVINKLEVELDEARAAFRQLLSESTQRINLLAKKLGACVDKARPYYEARMTEKKAHMETQKAALRFERANSAHTAAKEMVFLAEEGLQKEGRTFDPVWQEMLNHATMKVNEAESERTFSEQEHRRISKAYNEAEKLVQEFKKDLKKSIVKSSLSARRNLLQIIDLAHQHQLLLLPYFEMKAQFNRLMEEQKKRVQELEENVLKAKQNYADALHNLEEISDEIHKKRTHRDERLALGARGSGVGAEHPEPLAASVNRSPDSSFGRGDRAKENMYKDLPSYKTLPKSHSSCQLTTAVDLISGTRRENESLATNRNAQTVKLRKSKSVVDRTEAGPLFGRYSISKHHKLQVDSGSQTEDANAKSPFESVLFRSPSLHARSKLVTFDRLNVPAATVTGIDLTTTTTTSSNSTSSQSSKRNSPDGPIGRSAAASLLEESEVSDSESLASIECLTDEQIASLMLDKDLEDVIESFGWKSSMDEDEDDGFAENGIGLYGISAMTQTSAIAATVVCQHVMDADGERFDDSEDEVTVIETSYRRHDLSDRSSPASQLSQKN